MVFSNSIFVVGTRLMTRKDFGIRDFPDLIGKTGVVPSLTTSEELLRKLNAENKHRINIVSTIDRSVSALAVIQAGQADAYMHDDAILYGQIADAWRPDEWTVTGTPRSHEAYGCMMSKNDPAFKTVVDAAIAR
jgi:glutamate/aspartate transport system substrate-binding protein